MSTLTVYDSFLADVAKGNVDCDTDSFKGMLLTSTYTANKGTHAKRSDLTNEVTGTGYTAGGTAVTVTVTNDTTNHRCDIGLGAVSWTTANITARYLAVYKSRGGASSADELVAVLDFGADVTSTGATFSVSASTVREQN
jgi:hypothetical protein